MAGPKQVDWDNPGKLLEVGLRVTASARRANEIVPGEIDQGQYDDRVDVLAVGSAGVAGSPLSTVLSDGGKRQRQVLTVQAFRVIGADFVHRRPRRKIMPLQIKRAGERFDVFGA